MAGQYKGISNLNLNQTVNSDNNCSINYLLPGSNKEVNRMTSAKLMN